MKICKFQVDQLSKMRDITSTMSKNAENFVTRCTMSLYRTSNIYNFDNIANANKSFIQTFLKAYTLRKCKKKIDSFKPNYKHILLCRMNINVHI